MKTKPIAPFDPRMSEPAPGQLQLSLLSQERTWDPGHLISSTEHHSNVYGALEKSGVYAMNGKSVEIDNTDAERRLVMFGTLVLFVAPTDIIDVDF